MTRLGRLCELFVEDWLRRSFEFPCAIRVDSAGRCATPAPCAGTMTGSSIDTEDTLSFSSLHGIRPMIETVPLTSAAEGYGRMMRNEARFRSVLVP